MIPDRDNLKAAIGAAIIIIAINAIAAYAHFGYRVSHRERSARPAIYGPLPDRPVINIKCSSDWARGDDVHINYIIGQTIFATGGYVVFDFKGPECVVRQPIYLQGNGTLYQYGAFEDPNKSFVFTTADYAESR